MLTKKLQTFEKRDQRLRSNRGEEIRISLNEMPFPTYISDYPELIERLPTLELNRYPTLDDVQKIERLAADYLGCSVERVCLGNGLDDILFRMMLVFRGKKLGVIKPGFPCYAIYARQAGVQVCTARLSTEFELVDATLDNFMMEKPDLIVLAYPNNPTGNCFDREKIELLIKQLPNTVVIIDEAYYDFSGQSLVNLLQEYPDRLAITRTLSKGWGLAGVRIGFMAGPTWLVNSIRDLELPFHFNNFMLLVAEAAFSSTNSLLIEEVVSQREMIASLLKNHSFLKLYTSQSNFFWCKELGSEGWLRERFVNYGIKVKTYPDWPGYYRFSVGTSEENKRLLAALTNIKGV